MTWKLLVFCIEVDGLACLQVRPAVPCERCNLYACGSISYHQMGNQKQKEQKINMNFNKRRAEVKGLMIAAFAGLVMYASKDSFGF